MPELTYIVRLFAKVIGAGVLLNSGPNVLFARVCSSLYSFVGIDIYTLSCYPW